MKQRTRQFMKREGKPLAKLSDTHEHQPPDHQNRAARRSVITLANRWFKSQYPGVAWRRRQLGQNGFASRKMTVPKP